jgi:hypothetical protein
VVFGGDLGGGYNHGVTEIYDPIANAWTTGPALNVARGGSGGVTIDNALQRGWLDDVSVSTVEIRQLRAHAHGGHQHAHSDAHRHATD